MNHPGPLGLVALDFYVPKQISYIWCMEATCETQGGSVRMVYVNISWRDKKCMEHIFRTKTWYYLEIDMIFDMSIFGSCLF